MIPARTDGQRCPTCNSPYLLKLGDEWWCDSCFRSSPGFFPTACQAWINEFEQKDSFWLRLRHPFQNRFARIASIWPPNTEEELREIFTALQRIDAMCRTRDLREQEQWRRGGIPPSAWGASDPTTPPAPPDAPESTPGRRPEDETRELVQKARREKKSWSQIQTLLKEKGINLSISGIRHYAPEEPEER